MSNAPLDNREITELLIVSVTPQNLERGALWFTENLESIKKARGANFWWQQNAVIIENDLKIKPFELAQRLVDLGYERSNAVAGRGLFAIRGGIVDVWPINADTPYLIEFASNSIKNIHVYTGRAESVTPRPMLNRSVKDLPLGSFVVHQDHGIGIFRGISDTSPSSVIASEARQSQTHSERLPRQQLPRNDMQEQFFIIEYAPPAEGRAYDRLLVPVNQEERLTAYIGLETPHIHRLGGSLWQSTKRKAKEDAEKLARQLLELYAKRTNAQRPPCQGDAILEEDLRDRFAFQETPDQLRCEQEILQDFASTTPMDRVICGDVGFGKTELAIRAALRAITSGRQVAFLSPTTILAAQHLATIQERFRDFPIRIAQLSRITSPTDEKKILAEIKNGAVDCVIGTHRLLSQDVEFKNLGLAIIDEEQRFGVKQKERIKQMRGDVDILSLSATPIPRTMQLTLAKLRDISFLETPPPSRLPVATFVLPYRQHLIKEAMTRELERGGQVYFLHNRVDTMGITKQKIEKLLNRSLLTSTNDRSDVLKITDARSKLRGIPDGIRVLKSDNTVGVISSARFARSGLAEYLAAEPRGILPEIIKKQPSVNIGIIHGRMKEKELLAIMQDFRAKKIHVLVATTIIENGLDISSANTLIVDDATRLGLAQAHQLRGRIGRGNDQAYSYFLYRPKHLTPNAAERLEALRAYAGLGSGYQIALRDLEIRGAGNILGREQSGTANTVGLNLYCQMLAESIEWLQQQ